MKSKFGTALALTAVLVTGTAAAAINTQALNSPTGSTLETATTTLLPVDQLVSVDTQAPTSSLPGTSATPVSTNEGDVTQIETNSLYPTPATETPVVGATPPIVATNPGSASPNVVDGNPNPATGEDEDDDEYEEEDDDDDDEDDDEDYDDEEDEDEDDD